MPVGKTGGSGSPPPVDHSQDPDDVEALDSGDVPEEVASQFPQGTVNQLKTIPPTQRAAILQMAQMYGYAEFSFGGQTFWFSPDQVFSAFGNQGKPQGQMPPYGSAPGPQGGGNRQAMMGGGGGTGSTRQFYSGPGQGPGGGPGTPQNYYTGGGGYGGYGTGGGMSYGGYGPGNTLYDLMMGGQMQDDMYAQRSQFKKTEHEMRVKMQKVMLMILMGDVVGAMREMVFESEKQNRMFNRLLVKQLNRVREAKSKILLSMGRKRPPTAHDNTNDAAGAARDQNKQAKYTQWVSVTTQLMSEVQQTERELLDLLSEGRRNINELWEAYSGLKEAESRTTRTVIQAFRG